MKPRQLLFYISSLSGKCHGEEFLLKLSKKAPKEYAQIRARLARVQSGNLGNYRDLGGRTIELKISRGAGYRLYCTITNSDIIVVFANIKGQKKSQNLEIQKAKALVNEFWAEQKEQ